LLPKRNGIYFFNLDRIISEPSVKILNFGDVMFDRGVRNIIENRKRDPFEYIKKDLDLLKSDVFIVNLEGPIVEMDRSLCQQKAYNFQFAPSTTEILKSIGVNMVTIANNHSYDCLMPGYESTIRYLNSSGILFMGEKEYEKSYTTKVISGKKVAFVGMDETVQPIPVSGFYEVVRKLKNENDIVVVNIHWGTEYMLSANENQIEIAHRLVDSGADVIFGHHPHVVQNMEVYKGRAIFYSLGNFVFDQNFGDTTVGLGVKVEFKEKETIFELFPLNIKVFAPDLMKGEEREKFCKKFLGQIPNKDCRFEIKI
jgi:poly-gamma-glutamate synthesis protein (capsule biosynthesis protein)